MEELDLLKKDWNKNNNFPKFSEKEIYAMLHKNSSSTVKWIFIISILELGFGLVLGIILSFTKFDEQNTQFIKNLGIYTYYQIMIGIMYAVIVYFIARFYIMYKKVSTTDNTKLLMKNILRTRKTVQNYILFNLVTFAVLFVVIFTFGLKKGIESSMLAHNDKITEIPTNIYIFSFLVVVLVTATLTTAFWFFYKLLYGFLLKRLKKNFEELKKIDL
jgi:hypothetical protein